MSIEEFISAKSGIPVYSILDCVIVKEDDSFFGLCLNVDVATQGDSIEETKRNLKEAVASYLEEVMNDSTASIFRFVPNDANPLLIQKEAVVELFRLFVNEDISLKDYDKVA